MGIDIVGYHAFLEGFFKTKNNNRALTLGRQAIDINYEISNIINSFYNLHIDNETYYKNNDDPTKKPFIDDLLINTFNFKMLDTLDNSNYENASIVHDMNLPLTSDFKKYDFILDGGTIEHIFNIPQVIENIINLLDIDGVFVSITCNNNYSGHGFYQFSPDFFYSTMQSKYGMELLQLKLAKLNTQPNEWIDVSELHKNNNGRNIYHFDTNMPVYIVCIAKKISNNRESILLNPPQQYSYESIQWKQ